MGLCGSSASVYVESVGSGAKRASLAALGYEVKKRPEEIAAGRRVELRRHMDIHKMSQQELNKLTSIFNKYSKGRDHLKRTEFLMLIMRENHMFKTAELTGKNKDKQVEAIYALFDWTDTDGSDTVDLTEFLQVREETTCGVVLCCTVLYCVACVAALQAPAAPYSLTAMNQRLPYSFFLIPSLFFPSAFFTSGNRLHEKGARVGGGQTQVLLLALRRRQQRDPR
jgi:hypothetical protein